MRIIDNNITTILSIVSLVYFAGIACYSLLPDCIYINEKAQYIFYWINNTVFLFSITFLFANFVIERRTKILLRGLSFFLLSLGIFQIIKSSGIEVNQYLWAWFCPLYILFIKIIIKYVRN